MTMRSKTPGRTVPSMVMALAVSGVVVGVFLVAYASLLLPDEVGRGQNPLSGPHRWLQFAFACGVPLAAAQRLPFRFCGHSECHHVVRFT